MSSEPGENASTKPRRRLSLGYALLVGGILLAVSLLVGMPLLTQGDELSSTGTMGDGPSTAEPTPSPTGNADSFDPVELDSGEAATPDGPRERLGCEAFASLFTQVEPPFESVDDARAALEAFEQFAQQAPLEVADEAIIARDTFQELLDLEAVPPRLTPEYFPEEDLDDPVKVAEGIARFFQDNPDFTPAAKLLQDYYDSRCASGDTAADQPAEASTSEVSFTHPSWGEVRLVVEGPASPPGPATVTVYDLAGTVRWTYENESLYSLDLAGTGQYLPEYIEADPVDGPVDDTGHIFLTFNPGRYDGVIVLSPVDDGFEDFATLPPSDGYDTRFYNAYAIDVNGDGVYEVESFENDCVPSCAEAEATSTIYVWNGEDYVKEAP